MYLRPPRSETLLPAMAIHVNVLSAYLTAADRRFLQDPPRQIILVLRLPETETDVRLTPSILSKMNRKLFVLIVSV